MSGQFISAEVALTYVDDKGKVHVYRASYDGDDITRLDFSDERGQRRLDCPDPVPCGFVHRERDGTSTLRLTIVGRDAGRWS